MNYFLIILLLFLSACGKPVSTLSTMGDKLTPNTNLASPLGNNNTLAWRPTKITTPAQGILGAAVTLYINEKPYLISDQTPQSIKDYLYNLPAGSVIYKETYSNFFQESGHFPNPTVTFDVVNVQNIR
jgi:hypothetical protein